MEIKFCAIWTEQPMPCTSNCPVPGLLDKLVFSKLGKMIPYEVAVNPTEKDLSLLEPECKITQSRHRLDGKSEVA